MILNKKKTKSMIFNFTNHFQFTTRMVEGNVNIEVVSEVKLLGTWITSDLSWNKNAAFLTKRAYARMQLLHKAAKFTRSKRDLKIIYTTFIRPVLEQSSCVWHSSLTLENASDLERVQKAAVRVITGTDFIDYTHALNELKIQVPSERRAILSKNMPMKIVKHPKLKYMIPLRKEVRNSKRRYTEKYENKKVNTQRLNNSAIPYLKELLNNHDIEVRKWTNMEE